MKNKIIVAAGAVFLASVVSATVYRNYEKNSKDAFLRANVEALSQDESGADGNYFPNSVPMPVTTCGVPIGTNIWGNPVGCTSTIVLCQGSGSGCTQRLCPLHDK